TVGVVTKPFQFEGAKRMRQAEDGVDSLQKVVDTLIIIPNQNLFRLANEKTTFTEAFSMADDVLYQGVKGVTDLMVRPGLINLDFADVRAVMDEMGKAMMGTGEAEGEDRAIQAAEKAIANPLLDEISLRGAKGVLINITGAHDLTLFELDEAANRIREEVDPDANIIVGSTLDTDMQGTMRVSVVATGIDATDVQSDVPVPRRSMSAPLAPPSAADAPADESAALEEPAAVSVAAAAEEPGLFDGVPSAEQTVASDTTEELFETERAEDDDGLPPPAYRPEVPAFEPRADNFEAAPETFVAPRAPAPGTPSPETMERLRVAVNKTSAQHQTDQAAPHAQPDPRAVSGGEKRGFGINSLINRMTGQAADTPASEPVPAPHQPQPQPVRSSQPSVGAAPQRAAQPEQERIEIPAFLRRQAN
ncbi:MAG: cell division protein FtsZ, partial [Pseudomonadota bacterium]